MAGTDKGFLHFMSQNTPMDLQLKELNINSNYYDIESLQNVSDVEEEFQYIALHINIHSIPDKLHKLKNILSRLRDVNIKVHFILLCETFLNEYNKSMCDLPGYKLVPESRKQMTKGGVALYISDEFDFKQRHDISATYEGEFETVFVEIVDKNKTLIVGEIYRIPNTNESISIGRFENVLEQIRKSKPNYCIIGTDQNFDYMKVNSHNNTLSLFNCFLSAEMIPTITKPTRIVHKSATLIDNIYVRCDVSRVFSAILLSDISDHLPVLTCTGKKPRQSKTPLVFSYRPLNELNIGLIKDSLSNTNWDNLQNLSTNDAYNSLLQTLNKIIDTHAPVKTSRISSKCILREPWIYPRYSQIMHLS